MKRGEWFKKITHAGIINTADSSSNRGIILSNQIVIFLIPLLLFSIVLEYNIQDFALMMSFVVLVPFLLFIYFLNSTYHIRISRYLLSTGPNLIILIVILMVGDIQSGNYLGLPLAFIGLSFFAVLLFDFQSERALLIYASMINLIILLTFDLWLDMFGKNEVNIDLIRDNYLLYKSTHVLLWMTISFCILFLKRLNHQFELRLQKQNVELKNISDEILAQNEEIVSQNKELHQQQEQILKQKQFIEDQNVELKHKEEAFSKSLQSIRDAQKELAKKEAESRSILNALKDHFIVIEYDLKGKVHFVNETLLRASGITKDHIITNSIGNKFKDRQFQNQGKGHSFNTEMEFETEKGRYCINATHAPIFDEFGKVDRILAIGFDVQLNAGRPKGVWLLANVVISFPVVALIS
jgi:PAS domain-containing protein